jgi:tight adherence protein B
VTPSCLAAIALWLGFDNLFQYLLYTAVAGGMLATALPFIVMILVYITTPSYISILWTTQFGQFLLLCVPVVG